MLNAQQIQQLVDPSVKLQVVTVEKTKSTQLLAKDYLAHHEDAGPIAFLADQQTAGYGQHGRHYYSPADTGLYLSLLLPPQDMHCLQNSGLLTTGIAVVLCHVLERHFPNSHLTLKWVNDLYQDGKKVAGILSEAVYQLGTEQASIIIGIGINLNTDHFPAELNQVAGALTDEAQVDRNRLVSNLLNELLVMLDDYADGQYLAEYRQRCFILGRSVAVKTHGGIEQGTAIDIDAAGSLVIVDHEGKQRVIQSGEVMKVNT